MSEYLEIKNIGKIRNAKVKLDGLNIIAGENDSGKSTVGKVIFSIVKAISRHEEDFQINKEQQVFELLEKLFYVVIRKEKIFKLNNLQGEFLPANFLYKLKPYIKQQTNLDKNALSLIFNHKRELLSKIENEKTIVNSIELLNEIEEIILKTKDKKTSIAEALKKAFISEFHFELSNRNNPEIGSISYYSTNTKIFNLGIKDNTIKSVISNDKLLFTDATYVESPIYLQLTNLIDYSDTLFDFDIKAERALVNKKPKVSLHIKDLINKLEQAKYFSDNLSEENVVLSIKVSDIMNGHYTFDKENKEYIFKGKDGTKLKVINTASGIKSFGIIQLLIESNSLDERSLLIIDEPENHLHPEWQIKYADVITELIKNNISIIINSHSPYMIQALKHFSKKKGIDNMTNFYLTELDEKTKLVDFKDVTDNTDAIFAKLAEPLNKIAW